MDKKNLIAFLSLSLAVLVLWNILFPPLQPPKPQPGQNPAAVAGDQAKADGDEALADGDDADEEEAADEAPAEAAAPTALDAPLEYLTLGSLDRETGYRMLVTLTNQGAAVRRAELSSPRFLDLSDRSGYLGHLELEETADGLKVQVVGKGTPAEEAKLKVGDVIVSAQRSTGDPVKVSSIDEFEAVRAKSKPGNEFKLSVLRNGSPLEISVKLVRRPLEVMRPEIDNIRMRDVPVPAGFVDPPSFLMGIASVGEKQFPANAATQLDEWIKAGHKSTGRKAKELSAAVKLKELLDTGNWQVTERGETSVTFERPLPDLKLALIKHYSIEPVPEGSRDDPNYPGYHLKLDVGVRNTSDAQQDVAYRLDGPTGLPLEGWWYTHKISRSWSGAGLRDVVVRFFGSGTTQFNCAAIAQDKTEPMGQGASLAFVGVDAVYFSAVMIPVKQSLEEDWFDSTEAIRIGPKPDPRDPHNFLSFTNVSCRLTRKQAYLAPGQTQQDSYQIFVGPKRPELLAQYKAAGDPDYSLRDIIYYGMWPFSAVARGMLTILHFFYSIIGNFGIAIIMLTVLVRGAMFPISFKQTQNMARMQALKPELDRLNEKYKTDMQKRSQAMQELYRKHQINPLGGCLPVFLQLPIFMGLYRSIMIDVELRQRPLFTEAIRWCSDLSAPDMLYNWSGFMPKFVSNAIGLPNIPLGGMLGLGPYFNLLPLITIALFLVSMKMSMPEPTNEQTAMQQKMMKYMTVFMGLMFYKVACGLCLYFIASSLWGLGERRLLKKTKEGGAGAGGDGPDAVKRVVPPSRGPTGGGSNGVNGSAGRKKSEKARRKR
ncbi:MAG: membrane protein insertase YidC [Pirellulales bacterium]